MPLGFALGFFVVHRMLLEYGSVRSVAQQRGGCPRGDAIVAQALCRAKTPAGERPAIPPCLSLSLG
jgi:hypothetical protein